MTNIDIKIKEMKYTKYDELHLEFSGKDVNHVLINTLRRIIIQHIPIYAFDNETISITKNTSVYNNDVLRLRLNFFPIKNINKPETINLYTDIINNEVNTDKLEKINMYVSKKNNDIDILNVTTDDAEFSNKNNKISNIYKNPLLIVKLKQNEEIKLSASCILDIGKKNIKHSSVSICVFEKLNDNKYILKLESTGQIEEYDIVKRACKILLIKLELIEKQIDNFNINLNENKGQLLFEDEDHTIGNFINRFLQNHTNIIFSGYKMDHLLIDNTTIDYTTNDVKDIKKILNECILLAKRHINHIIKNIK